MIHPKGWSFAVDFRRLGTRSHVSFLLVSLDTHTVAQQFSCKRVVSDAAARRIERVLWNDPGTGVMRHADAGYEEAIACARENKLNLPMIGTGSAS